jgi:hypothetical protein
VVLLPLWGVISPWKCWIGIGQDEPQNGVILKIDQEV